MHVNTGMKHFLAASFALLSTSMLACAAPPGAEDTAGAGSAIAGPLESFHVVLDGPPAVRSIPRGADPRSPEAAVATRARIAEIEAEHAAIEPALEARGAVVVARLSRLANAIQILADEEAARRIEALAGVRRVERVPLLERTLATAVPVIRAPALWAGEPPLLGDGVTIGIVDSGIDYTHADFGGAGTAEAYLANDPTILEPGTFPSGKIAGGWDFVGDAYNPSAGVSDPQPDPDPLDCTTEVGEDPSGGHGTHVAGVAAGAGVLQDGSTFDGPYAASFAPGVFRVAPGVAPRATLHALKVFGCEGPTTMLAAALERAADPNEDGSFDDRLDIVNASLGSPYGLGSPTEAGMVAELTGLGTLIVAGAGNEGATFFSTGSPGTYPEVLSVAVSVANRLVHVKATAPGADVAIYPGAEGVFTEQLDAPVSAELVLADPALACAPLVNAADVAGKIALIDRGECLFVDKLTHALNAGAVAAIVADNVAADLPFMMGGESAVAIPGVMVTQADGAALKDALASGPVVIDLDPTLYTGPGAELLSGLGSRGPSPIDGRLKPEIAAPGVAIDSAGVGSGSDARRLQGTSIASPMVAGAAALVRQAQPGLSAFELKAALVNAAVPLFAFNGVPYGTGRIGGGRIDVARAAQARVTAAADPATGEVGVSFGAVVADAPATVKRTFVVTNHSADPVSLEATLALTHGLPGVTVTITPEAADLPAGEAATFELTLALDPALLGKPGPDPGTPATQGQEATPRHYLNEVSGFVHLVETGDGQDPSAPPAPHVLPFNGSVRAAVLRKASPPVACQTPATKTPPVEIPLIGAGAHPEPVVTAFQLAALDEQHPDAEADPNVAVADLRAVGVATNLATAPSFDEARVFFGVAVTGTWTTPARGPVSLVSIAIDADLSGEPESELRVEAWTRDGPFRDALVTRVYDLATGEAKSHHPINIAAPSAVQTHPFYSSVLVLEALLSELGVDQEHPVFGWTAKTERPDLMVVTDEVGGSFDAQSFLVDTARHGNGKTPLFVGPDPVRVALSPAALAAGTPASVLLLHHTNVPGERWEVVSVEPRKPGNLALDIDSPPTVDPGKTVIVSLFVKNDGAEPTPEVSLSGMVLDGQLVGAVSDQGTCDVGSELGCALGDLSPGESVSITATVLPAEGASSVTLQAIVTSALPCETDSLDNAFKAAMGVRVPEAPGPDPDVEDVFPGGGCACRTGVPASGDAGSTPPAAWLVAALGVLAARRRARLAGGRGRPLG